MEDEKNSKIKSELEGRPKRLINLEQWLYVVINTAKAIIDNTIKNKSDIVMEFAKCNSTGQIQYEFDITQGKFGRENFSQRYNPNYLYLCSLVANFPDQELSDKNKESIRACSH